LKNLEKEKDFDKRANLKMQRILTEENG